MQTRVPPYRRRAVATDGSTIVPVRFMAVHRHHADDFRFKARSGGFAPAHRCVPKSLFEHRRYWYYLRVVCQGAVFQGKGPPECPAVHETSGRPLQSISDCDTITGKVALISLFDVFGHRIGACRIAACYSGSAMRVIFLPFWVLSHILGCFTRTGRLFSV